MWTFSLEIAQSWGLAGGKKVIRNKKALSLRFSAAWITLMKFQIAHPNGLKCKFQKFPGASFAAVLLIHGGESRGGGDHWKNSSN